LQNNLVGQKDVIKSAIKNDDFDTAMAIISCVKMNSKEITEIIIIAREYKKFEIVKKLSEENKIVT
jgi:hypothetical protein